MYLEWIQIYGTLQMLDSPLPVCQEEQGPPLTYHAAINR